MEEAEDIPQKVGSCIDKSKEKAHQLYTLLYELLENQGYGNRRKENKHENSI